MKKRGVCLCLSVLILAVALLSTGCGKKEYEDTITVFNYGMYIDPDVLDQFTEETGIKVNYEEAPTPEELYTKYKAGSIDYDLLCTSDYMLEKLIEEGEFAELNMADMENTQYIDDRYWDFAKSFDPENKYTVPYFWGTVGILYDTTKVHGPIDSWDVLFNGEYAGEFIMQNSMRDAYMVALRYLGYSMNTENTAELDEAQQLLLAQKDDVQAYLVDEARDEVVAGNATMTVIYSGDGYLGMGYNENLDFALPKEGTNVWMDSWGITADSKHKESAMKFLNFLCREDIAWKNFEYVGYSSPIDQVNEKMDDAQKANKALCPPEEDTESAEVYKNLSAETTAYMNDLWKELKAE